jgi:hypothetical protein
MHITVCASMAFAKEMLELRDTLKILWHQVTLPPDTENFLNARTNEWDITQEIIDEMKSHYTCIEQTDAVLIANYPKNGIDGYVGWATLMELAIGFHFNKKVFILHPLPTKDQLKYIQEILLTSPIILDWDVSRIQ